MPGEQRINIVIASKGRPEVLRETIESLCRQTLKPERVIVVVPANDDLPENHWGNRVQYIVGPHGSALQRNKGLEVIPDTIGFVGFFDDDFELRADYLEAAVNFLNSNPSVVGISGCLLANGNVSREKARELVSGSTPERSSHRGRFFSRGKHHILHGCNMTIRRAVLKYEIFDENLPFYSYAEDYELSVRLEHYGLIGRFDGCVGVHLEAPGGRVREVLRGYSLIANNWYFLKKGVVHLPFLAAWIRFWLVCVGKRIFLTLWSLLGGDRSVDWGGRLKGHLLALRDIFLGRCRPDRIKEI